MQSGFPNCYPKRIGVSTFPLFSSFWRLFRSMLAACVFLPFPSVSCPCCSPALSAALTPNYLHHSQPDSYLQSSLSVDIYVAPHTLPYSFVLCLNIVHNIHSFSPDLNHISLTLQAARRRS